MPMVPNAPKLFPTSRFLKGIHTPTANKITDMIPIGLSRFIKPVISCTPFAPPYWFSNIGNKLIVKAMDKMVFFFIRNHASFQFRFF